MVLSNTLIVIIPLVIKQDIIASAALDGERWAIKKEEITSALSVHNGQNTGEK